MKPSLKTLALGMLALLLFALPLASMPFAPGDQIWDALNTVNGVTLKAKYKESPDNGLIDQSLEVELDNAMPNMTFTVKIKKKRLGTLTTDGFGTGIFRVKRLGIVPGPDGRPPRRKRINTGDLVTVLNSSIGFSLSADFQPRP